ncbi:hypothetical protein CNEO2_530040 [Clostridium neonatale]|nr:hypothetical protein CNEO2_530040 [Clostridium neonatale]
MKGYPFSIQKTLSLEYDTENRIISKGKNDLNQVIAMINTIFISGNTVSQVMIFQ